jgi:hypothetical protein
VSVLSSPDDVLRVRRYLDIGLSDCIRKLSETLTLAISDLRGAGSANARDGVSAAEMLVARLKDALALLRRICEDSPDKRFCRA